MKCKYCKHPIHPTFKICHTCGKPLRIAFYKSGWLWTLPILLAFVVLGVFTSKADYSEDILPKALNESAKQDITTDAQHQPLMETTLSAGTFITGTDIVPGRYIITANTGIGTLYIYRQDAPYINEVLTYPHNSDSTIGVTKVEANLSKGDLIQISGLDSVTFSPAPIFEKTTLVAGYHLVGRDVPSGDYTLSVPKGTGQFTIYDTNNCIRFTEALTMHLGVDPEDKLSISLFSGELIKIDHLDSVRLSR